MSVSFEGKGFQIEEAMASDWPWLIRGHMEIALVSLGHEPHTEVSLPTVQQRIARQVAWIRAEGGYPNLALVARDEHGHRAGFVWVAKIHHDSTGEPQAFVLSEYVAEPYRGQGLGHRLMKAAEDWAHQQGLQVIALSVDAHNTLARRLYETLGYQAEMVRMVKPLGT